MSRGELKRKTNGESRGSCQSPRKANASQPRSRLIYRELIPNRLSTLGLLHPKEPRLLVFLKLKR